MLETVWVQGGGDYSKDCSQPDEDGMVPRLPGVYKEPIQQGPAVPIC